MPYKDAEVCREKNREYTQRRRVRLKPDAPSGVCGNYPDCKNPVESGRKRCPSCLSYMREYKKTYRAKEAPPGICSRYPDCANPTEPGKKQCHHCTSLSSQHQKGRRDSINQRNHEIKEEVLRAYGGSCVCCGETEVVFLTIDHAEGYNGIGPRGGIPLYRWLKRNGFPSGFRTLCMNCNFALGHHGYCPHGSLTQRPLAGRPVKDIVQAEANREGKRLYWIQRKMEVLNAYGGPVCACCGETHLEFLTIDHINNDGANHRVELTGKNDSRNFYVWLRQNNFPPGFQVLCMNCNWGKGRYGRESCPHRVSSGS